MLTVDRSPCDEGVVQAGAACDCARAARPWVLATTILGSSLAFILSSVVNVALPAIQQDLGASMGAMQWIVNAYVLLLGALILVGGAAGDHYGLRRVFALGVLVFAVASVGCALAPSTGWLIGWRAVQGVGGALLVPSSLALISAAYPAEERGRAIGTWAGFAALTTALGPVLGGWLVDTLSWRWVFAVVVPPALVTLGLTAWRVPRQAPSGEPAPLDGWGVLLVAVGLGALTFGLIAADARGLSDPLVLAALGAGAAGLVLFVVAERRQAAPMVPPRLFRAPTFAGANALTGLLYFALGGAFFFLPFALIQVLGFSATAAGAAFLPFTLVMGLLSRWSGGLLDRYGARKPLVAGPLIAAAGLAWLGVPGPESSYWTGFFPGLLILGFGMAVSVAPLTTVVMNAVDDRHAGTASGINNAVARVAQLLAVAVLGLVVAGRFTADLEASLVAMDVPASVEEAVLTQRQQLAAAQPPDGMAEADHAAVEAAIDQAFMRGFRLAMLLASGLAVAGSASAFWLIDEETAAEDDAAPAA